MQQNVNQDLSRTLDDVDAMVAAIRDIASKTDLLALNASIEAARAGQAGKGFAIVADEVGRLSEKVQQSVGAIENACLTLRKQIQAMSRNDGSARSGVSANSRPKSAQAA